MIRLILVFLVIFLIVRLFYNIGREVPYPDAEARPPDKNISSGKKSQKALNR